MKKFYHSDLIFNFINKNLVLKGEEIPSPFIFMIVLFIYTHIYYNLKTSSDLEVYEVDNLSKDKLEDICYRIFKAAGGTDDHSKTTGDHLVAANLAGHDSHGFVQIPNYIQQIDTASLDPTAEPTIHNETSTTAQVHVQVQYVVVDHLKVD